MCKTSLEGFLQIIYLRLKMNYLNAYLIHACNCYYICSSLKMRGQLKFGYNILYNELLN